MIDSTQFYRLKYPEPHLHDDRPIMDNIVGIDSEAYVTGEPFMLCTSRGDVFGPEDVPHFCFLPEYENANYMVYNLKYDSGALLYHLPDQELRQLWAEGVVKHDGYKYKYIPHKLLRISSGKLTASFWDISQFYKMSLNKASGIYLGKQKIDIATKKFTEKYVRRFWRSIAKYCIQDATLTAELGEYLVNKLDQFGITSSTLYSCASISFKYFCENTNVVTVSRFWKTHKKALGMACDAYEGGKFEVTARGSFERLYEYDITSAYPYEIARLVDITDATVEYSPRYDKEAVYAFYRVHIDNTLASHLPCGIMTRGVRIYPAGEYYLTITKQEYEYMLTLPVRVTILDGVHFYVKRKRYPYKKVIATLFKLKSDYKNKDKMLYNTTKIIMNSFYGKCVQCIEQPDKTVVAGSGWNPIYGAVITANTRIKVTALQNLMQQDCVAVHTDSVMTTRPVPSRYIKKGLGEFEYVVDGPGLLVACGMYQIGDTCAFKGFYPRPGDTWEKILTRHRNRQKIPYSSVRVESWVEAMAKNHGKRTVNVFARMPKIIDINCDTKRIWYDKLKARHILERSYNSEHRFHLEPEPPKYWSEKKAKNSCTFLHP